MGVGSRGPHAAMNESNESTLDRPRVKRTLALLPSLVCLAIILSLVLVAARDRARVHDRTPSMVYDAPALG